MNDVTILWTVPCLICGAAVGEQCTVPRPGPLHGEVLPEGHGRRRRVQASAEDRAMHDKRLEKNRLQRAVDQAAAREKLAAAERHVTRSK